MNKTLFAGLANLSAILVLGLTPGCPQTVTSSTSCNNDHDCPAGQLCVSGECYAGRSDGGVTAACYSDNQCQAIDPSLICNSAGLCDLPSTGSPCTVTADCPIDQFCNFQSQVCVALQPGYCREASQCGAQKCSATAGGVGRCVECMTGADCPSGQCQANGTCAASSATCTPPCQTGYTCNLGQCVASAGDCNPPCLATEQCAQGVCYGENGCPRNAHPVNNQCACDDGFVPNASGNACVPEGQSCDPNSQLACQQQGGTWDAVNCVCMSGGSCNPPCGPGTSCQNNVCVAVGGACTSALECLMAGGSSFMTCDTATSTCVCDALQGFVMCFLFDAEFDENLCDCTWVAEVDAGSPPDAARPDTTRPDTGSQDAATQDSGGGLDAGTPDSGSGTDAGSDRCASNGWYGDGECDTFCPQPDPDCLVVGGTGATCTNDNQCIRDYSTCDTDWPGGYCWSSCDYDYYGGECGTEGACICLSYRWSGACRDSDCYSRCSPTLPCRSGYSCELGDEYDEIYVCVPN
ncbi:MAG: hypothetical protein ABIJ09_03410 [Pseudomonadota bacterium]